MHSGFDPLDWVTPWRIKRPARTRPPLGPERDAWLEQRMLFQSARSLKFVLDGIDPAIARNESIAAIDEDAVTIALLEFLECKSPESTSVPGKGRMPLHKARVFLDYFARGFRTYCQIHGLRQLRLPLVREFSLDEGSLRAGTFDGLREYRRCVGHLIGEIDKKIFESCAQAVLPNEIAALVACSGALFGGLARERHWQVLIARLSSPLQINGVVFRFELGHSTRYCWIADPVTEALIRRLWQREMLPLPEGTKVPPTLIKRTLGIQVANGEVISHLEFAVRAAHVRYFAPDVTAVAQGHIPNTPLAEEPWLRLISSTRHPAPRAKVALAIPRITLPVQADTLQQVSIQEIIDEISAAVRWDPTARRKQGSQKATDGQGVKEFFSRAKVLLRASEGRLEQLYVRAGHMEGHRQCFVYGLLCYARDLLELGGLKLRNLAPSTIANYVGIVRNHLTQLHFADLVVIGTEARADAYRIAIRQQLVKDRTDQRTAFEGFERSILRHMDLIDEVDWATIPGLTRKRHLPGVDANLVGPGLYRHVFESLKASAQGSSIVQLACALLVILYRFGLRTGEAVEVKAGALVLHADGHASLRVTGSVLTSRKSANALRLVGPVDLPKDEFEFLVEYREQRAVDASRRGRDRAGIYLFATGAGDKLEHVEAAQELLIEMLRTASGDPHLRLRHLRHTFVSRLFLTERDPLGCLTPVSLNAAGDAWWRTFAAGHASPDTGIISYTHAVEVAHYLYASQIVSEEAPLAWLSRLAGNDIRSLERTRLRSTGDQRTVAESFLESLRRNFPCAGIPDALNHRTPFTPLALQQQATEPIREDAQRLTWENAWDVYASARIGRATSDMSDQAAFIRKRVRDLEMSERLVRRLKRRPQLAAEEAAAAAAMWQALAENQDLQKLINDAANLLRPRGAQILMPTAIARELELRLRQNGLVRIQSRQGNAQQRWLSHPDQSGNFSTTWLELLGFLYSGQP